MRLLGGVTAAVGAALIALAGSITPATADGQGSEFNYVALGDSYSAGFGLGDYETSSPFSAAPDANGCYQSANNYPHQVATALGLAIADQTCSGAVTANLGYKAGSTIPNPTLTPPVSQTLPTLTPSSQQQTTATGKLAPQLQTQSLSADTDLVTVAIGGNDLGFADIAEGCIRIDNSGGSTATGLLVLTSGSVSVDNCSDYFGDSSSYPQAILSDRIADVVQGRIAAVFDEIAALAPNARVVVVGYPRIATDDASAANACWQSPIPPTPTGGVVPFSGTDILFIHDVEEVLDAALQTEATAHSFEYVSSWPSTDGHGLCDPDPWIFALDLEWPSSGNCPSGYQPLGYDGNVYVCAKLGALHPNQDGADNLAQLVEQRISSVPMLKTGNKGTAAPGAALDVSGLGFQAGEQVELVLHSTPVTIGTPTASGAGTFTGSFIVPSSVPPGAHTLVATGLTSGRSVSFAVTVQLPPTGADPALPAALGIGLVLLGGVLMTLRRRKPAAE